MIVKIDALDTLFFRDGKPFTMGEDTWANGVFPPSPSVIYGALRSAYFSNHIDELGKANEVDDPTKGLKIKGLHFLIGNDIYFSLPLDCVKEKEDKDKPVKVSTLSMRKDKSLNNCPTTYILSNKNDKKIEHVADGLVRKSMFEKYLILQLPEKFSIQKIGDYLISESKIGIMRSAETHTSEEGKLYRTDMRRLSNKNNEKLSIIVDFEGMDLPDRGLLKFGGEGKAVSYEQFKAVDFSIANFNLNENKFKLYLSTPAIFEKGWLPKWIDEKTLTGTYKGLKLKLLTASIGKPVHIGGFDIKEIQPKPMRKSVPAGSVYYFEIIEGNIQKAVEIFNQSAISEFYQEQGFGIVYVGKLQE
jgi:CRISPR-associated protein Cmr3